MKQKYHLIVVGTEVSGLISAYLAAKNGLKVLILGKGELAGASKPCGTYIVSPKIIAQLDENLAKDIPVERVLTTKSLITANNSDFVELKRKHKIENEDAVYICNKSKFIDWLIVACENAGAEFQSNVIAKKALIEERHVVGVEIHTGFKYYAQLTLINDDNRSNLLSELNIEQEIDVRKNVIYASEFLSSSQVEINKAFGLMGFEGSAVTIIGCASVKCIASLFTFEDGLQLNVLVMPIEGDKPISEIDAMQALDDIKKHDAVSEIFNDLTVDNRSIEVLQIADDLNSNIYFGNGFLTTGTSANLYTIMNRENIKLQIQAGLYAFETLKVCVDEKRADKKFSGMYFNQLKESKVFDAIKHSNKMFKYLQNNPQFLSDYPQGLTKYSRELFMLDSDTESSSTAFEELTDIAGGFFNLLKDFYGLRKRLP